MAWYLKGEAGKTLDATARLLSALNITSCVLTFQSLAGDSLTWTAATADATGAGTIVPDVGQVVELYWNSTRKFRGHVTAPRMGSKQITITVEGPWWWLDRTNLTQVQTDATGATAERASYVFESQSLATSIAALIARAITNGVPMTAGTVATMFDVPKITLTEQSCANALATLLSWCPDALTWFDYSTSPPTLNVTRRGAVSAVTYTVGTDAVEIGELSPRLDLEVARNEIHYVTRNATTGKPAWASQASGTDVAGKRQIVTVSGPEIVDYLPKDDFETYDAQTAATYISAALVAQRDPGLKAIATTWGAVPGNIYDRFGSYYTSYAPGAYNGRALQYKTFDPLTILDSAGKAVAGMAGKFLLLTTDPPEWAMTLLGGIPVTITGTWLAYNTTGIAVGTAESGIAAGGSAEMVGWVSATSTEHYYIAYRKFSINAVLITDQYAALTTIYKPWDYTYVTPPAGLAAALVAAQAWVPWEGPLTLVADDCSGDNLLPYKYNLAAALTPCATMAALAKGISHDLQRGRTTIDLGAPARVDFGSLVSRVRSEPKDNIVYL
jgi:hypothetical protein